MSRDGLEMNNFVMYKKSSMDEQIIGKSNYSNSKFIPGIRLNGSNKPTACSLLKMLFEKHQVDTTDMLTLGELENFEDKNGNGTYKASYGHDDIIMTFVQIPMVQQSLKYKNLLEEMEEAIITGRINNKWMNPYQETNDLFLNSPFNQMDTLDMQYDAQFDIFTSSR